MRNPQTLFSCATGQVPAGGPEWSEREGVLRHSLAPAEGLLLLQPQLRADPAGAGGASLWGGAAGHCALPRAGHRAGTWGCQGTLLPPGECRAGRAALRRVCVSTGPFAGPETWSTGTLNLLFCSLPFR